MLDFGSKVAMSKIFSVTCEPPPHRTRDPAAPAPAWVFLEPQAYLADVRNATTAEAFSSAGHTVQVTVCVSDPLDVSYLCIHCPGVPEANCGRPSIVCSENDFLILSVLFMPALRGREYFVYKAGPVPSLRLLPGPYPRVLTSSDLGLLPRDDGDHFVLAVLCYLPAPWDFALHVFSSRTWAWSRKVPQVEVSSNVRAQMPSIQAYKVIQFGEGTLGWVDLWRGILFCNVLDEMPVARFITLPKVMAGNTDKAKSSAWPLRNVAYRNGMIKFVEIEKHERPDVDKRLDDDLDTLYESHCLMNPKEMGWRAMTWYKMTSWDHWSKGFMAYDKEISVDYPSHSKLLPDLALSDTYVRELTLKDLLASHPVLSLTCDCDDIVYLLCKSKFCNIKTWMIAVDLKKKMLVDLAPFPLKGYFTSAHPSGLSKYLNITPAMEGSSGGH
ncbi:hypothetical protein CFC21_050925 [Triticum aestivum]|uniref:DUF1618 domain-containing protein n=2 Tax=Triticum aestivum TaxID=4565 RepID=A0A3B6HP79_WHEAT|nr:uncharacterized protein LOC123081562 [Triticum aestivum]KAF7041094.1 hypothetical protein CFC21_050925 [Triticum aestivum]